MVGRSALHRWHVENPPRRWSGVRHGGRAGYRSWSVPRFCSKRKGAGGDQQTNGLPRVNLQRAGVVRNVDGELSEHRQRHELQDGFMGGRQNDWRRYAVVVCTGPVHRRDAPAVTGCQSGEAVLRPWSGQVVTDAALVLEELGSDHRTDRVATQVLRAGPAGAITEEPGDRVDPARLQIGTDHVPLYHAPIMRGRRLPFRVARAW